MGAGSPFPVVIVMRSRPAVSLPRGLPGMTSAATAYVGQLAEVQKSESVRLDVIRACIERPK